MNNQIKTNTKKRLIIIFSVIGILLFLLIAGSWIFELFSVEGVAMEPTYEDNDYLLINKFSKDFDRGDVVVFKYPLDKSLYYIKRIVGLPGEEIKIEDGDVSINGEILDESYVEGETYMDDSMILGDDEYYVLGDNRAASSDSRNWGPVQKDDIIGKVFFTVF